MKLLASRWFISHSTEFEKFYKLVIFSGRENKCQCVTKSTIMWKLSQILAIRIYFLYSSVSVVACFTMVYFGFDRARKVVVTGNIFLNPENNGQCMTRSTIMLKLSQILAIRIYFLYCSGSKVARFTIVDFSFDRARKVLENGNIFRSRK